MTFVGIGVMFLPLTTPDGSDPIVSRTDQGAAMWWVGTAMLFAAVIESWSKDRNPLILVAGSSASFFGLLGASYTLAHGNEPLLVLLAVGAFYSLMFGGIAVVFTRFIYRPIARQIRSFITRRSRSRRDDDPDD